jgi:hypothetical protein
MATFTNPSTAGIQTGGNRTYVASTTAVTGVTSVAEQILAQITIPAGLLTSCSRFSIQNLWTKNGIVDTATTRIRLGTLGTTADTALVTSSSLSAANRQLSSETMFYAPSSTVLRLITARDGINFYLTPNATAHPIDVVGSDMVTNNLIMSFSMQMSGTTDTPKLAIYALILN